MKSLRTVADSVAPGACTLIWWKPGGIVTTAIVGDNRGTKKTYSKEIRFSYLWSKDIFLLHR